MTATAPAPGDLVITWYDDKPVFYGGTDERDPSRVSLSVGIGQGLTATKRICPPDRVAPADTPIPASDPRLTVRKLARHPDPRHLSGTCWSVELPGLPPDYYSKRKRDAMATGLRRLAILDWHTQAGR